MKSYLITLTLLLSALISSSAYGRLFLDVSMIEKKGIDIGLTLGSEIHSTEEAVEGKAIVMSMSSGIKLNVNAKFIDVNKEEVGPPAKVMISGEVKTDQGKKIEGFFDQPFSLAIGESQKFSHRIEGERLDITIKAYLK